MTVTFKITTEDAKRNALYQLSSTQIGDDVVVTFKNEKESRSDAQHRLRWMWFTQMEKELAGVGKGRDREQWNLYYKHKFMPQILIAQDEDYDDIFQSYQETITALTGMDAERNRYMTQFWDRVISTKDMTVASMSDWLDRVENHARENYNLILKTPEDLMWSRER